MNPNPEETEHTRKTFKTTMAQLHHGPDGPVSEDLAEARHTEPSIARSTARPAQPLHLLEIRCCYLRTVNKLPGIPVEPE